MDLYYAKSLHGFTPPDPIPGRDSWDVWQGVEIREADRVLLFCSREYAESPTGSGAWRDVDYMQSNARNDGAPLRKFIPVGLGPYGQNSPFVPDFIHGATYYDLSEGSDGFDDLVRRFKSEPIELLSKATGAATIQTVSADPASTVSPPAPKPSTAGSALAIWRLKLDYLRQQEAIVSDAAQKFALSQQIEEAKAKIAELVSGHGSPPAGV
jgi:hypothetical protein